MSKISEAYAIPLNPENYEFVTHPYIPIKIAQSTDRKISPNFMTVGRCFDIKYGSKNCFAPSYQ